MRRYNATSARTLAVYLASQDNPEQSLCPHIHAGGSTLRKDAIHPSLREGGDDGQSSHNNAPSRIDFEKYEKTNPKKSSYKTPELRQNAASAGFTSTRQETVPGLVGSLADNMEVPVKVDHKSFVQAVFGTTAFKMVEWLAPRNMQRLAKSGENALAHEKEESCHTAAIESAIKPQQDLKPFDIGAEAADDSKTKELAQIPKHVIKDQEERERKSEPGRRPNMTKSASSYTTNNDEKPHLMRKNSHVRTSSDTVEQISRGNHVTHPRKHSDADTHLLSQLKSPRQTVVRQALISSPAVRMPEPTIEYVKTPISVRGSAAPVSPKITRPQAPDDVTKSTIPAKKLPKPTIALILEAKSHDPQSLFMLPPEIILTICEIFSAYDLSEDHLLFPTDVEEEIHIDSPMAAEVRKLRKQLSSTGSKSSRLQWLGFGEQSLFDVLSQPGPLLRSFTQDGKHVDNMSVWYLMLRLTRVSPSLVFDSLWRASASLFNAPDILTSTYDWTTTAHSELVPQDALSDEDAARLISVCMYALVSASPLVQDNRQLMNMSRIRSTGASMLGREVSAPELATLCMRYNDAFTNEHALRLARRLFAAIPNRLSYSELMKTHSRTENGSSSTKDVLHLLIDSFKMDMSITPTLNFNAEQIAMHEMRVTTLVLDWARTVMMQDWSGAAEVARHSSFGGALLAVNAICKFPPIYTALKADSH